jgi:sensor histidine kinase YesM
MNQHPFIFSNQLKYRLNRHLVFWVCWWLFCSVIYSSIPVPGVLPFFTRIIISATEALIFLHIHMFVAYSMVYLLVPFLLIKERYIYSIIAVAVLFLITAVLNALLSPHVGALRNLILDPLFSTRLPKRYAPKSFHYSIMAGLRGGVTVGGIAAAIKLMKYWYIKEQRNLQLQKENSEAQLQLLRAQIHPHFLFNTMNNIYSYVQNTSPVAATLIMGLSDLLRYMLYEGNQTLVPLSKELKMIKDYITLEKVRYDERLDVNLELPGSTEGFYIAPLLLLPLIENCFKHGLSNMVEQPWISLRVSLEGGFMNLKLVNGKAACYQTNQTTKGIGLENVHQRLALLYPKKHMFTIMDEDDVFIVDLKIELQKRSLAKEPEKKELMPANAEM